VVKGREIHPTCAKKALFWQRFKKMSVSTVSNNRAVQAGKKISWQFRLYN